MSQITIYKQQQQHPKLKSKQNQKIKTLRHVTKLRLLRQLSVCLTLCLKCLNYLNFLFKKKRLFVWIVLKILNFWKFWTKKKHTQCLLNMHITSLTVDWQLMPIDTLFPCKWRHKSLLLWIWYVTAPDRICVY